MHQIPPPRPRRQGRCSPASTGPATEHAVCVVDAAGSSCERFSVGPHRPGLTPADRPAAPGGRGARSESSGPTARWSRRCSRPGSRWSVIAAEPGQEPSLAATARPGTRTTGSTPTCWPTRCAPTGTGCTDLTRDSEATDRAADDWCVPARTSSTARVGLVNQLRAHPASSRSRRGRAVPRPATAAIARAFLRRFPTARPRPTGPRRAGDGRLAGRRGLTRPHPGRSLPGPAAHRPAPG